MKLYKISEDIDTPPHLYEPWLKNIKKAAAKIERNLPTKRTLLDDAEHLENKYLRSVNAEEEGFFTNLHKLNFTITTRDIIDRSFGCNISENISYYEMIRDSKSLLSIIPHHLYAKLASIATDIQTALNKSFHLDDYEQLYREGYLEEKEFKIIKKSWYTCMALKEYASLGLNIHKTLEAYRERQKIRNARYQGEKLQPTSQEIDTLYHATPFCTEILREGFKSKSELGIEILGGHTGDAISFTADKNIALVIAVSIKEVIDLANGKFGLKDLFKKSQELGSETLRDTINTELRRARRDGKPLNRSQLFHIYKLYLSILESKSIRYNPVFFGVELEDFAALNKENVGVLAADVEMNKTTEYLEAMEEFRVPINAIHNVKRIY
jgi:hypothetical protein